SPPTCANVSSAATWRRLTRRSAEYSVRVSPTSASTLRTAPPRRHILRPNPIARRAHHADYPMNTVWLIPTLACYARSAAGFAMERAGIRTRLARWATPMLAAGAALQTGDLLMRGIQAGNVPVTNFGQSLVFLAWLTALAGL